MRGWVSVRGFGGRGDGVGGRTAGSMLERLGLRWEGEGDGVAMEMVRGCCCWGVLGAVRGEADAARGDVGVDIVVVVCLALGEGCCRCSA